jgi:hypothetical protein
MAGPKSTNTAGKKKTRKPRSNCIYSVQERQVIGQFKEEYRSQPDSERRAMIFREKVLPAIYNYWTDEGKTAISLGEKERRGKVCKFITMVTPNPNGNRN